MERQLFKNEKWNGYVDKLRDFFYTSYYPFLLVLISFVFWISDLSVVGISVLLIVGLISFIINKDVSPLIVMIPIMVMTVSKSTFLENVGNIALIVVVGVLFLIAAIFNFVFYKQKLKMGKLTVPLICVSIALIFGSIGSPFIKDYVRGLPYVFYLGILMLSLYTYIISCTKIPDTVDKKRYFAKLVLTLTLLCLIQAIIVHLDTIISNGLDIEAIFRNMMYVGWSNRAGLALIMVLTLSVPFYIAESAKKHNFLWFNLSIIIYIILVTTGSRGGILFGTVEMVAITIYLLVKSKHKKEFLISIAIWATLVIIVIGIKWEFVAQLLSKFKELGLYSSGRTKLYKEAIELFLQYPLFGVGCGYIGPPENYVVCDGCTYWFHSTPLHIMAVMGVFGLFCYGYFYIQKFRIIFKKKDLFNIMMAIGLISFELQNLIDSGTFSPFPFLYTSILMTTILEITNKDEIQESST